MIRIRFHGRGGQGIKTASQILGSAAFLSGYQAQDFPLYGAERRGAPIVAFTRISNEPVLERGPIAYPDMILVGDETLLEDNQAAPLCGAIESTLVIVNSSLDSSELEGRYKFPAPPIAINLTDRCAQYLNKGHILSTALATAASRVLGIIELTTLDQAVEMELAHEVDPSTLKANLDLVQDVFLSLSARSLPKARSRDLEARPLIQLEAKSVREAAPIILQTGNMALRKTGNWRTERPSIDYEHCNKCLICYARCPDGTIGIDSEGRPQIDYDHCKGCMICAQECPGHFIQTVREAEFSEVNK